MLVSCSSNPSSIPRRFIVAAAMALGCSFATLTLAQSYPGKPIRLVALSA